MKLKGVYQHNTKDCGVACLLTIIKYYKGSNTFENIRYLTRCDNFGITALNLISASGKLGFDAKGIKCDIEDLKNVKTPAICHVTIQNHYNHYVVLEDIHNDTVCIFDPANGHKKYKKNEFNIIWNNIVIELIKVRELDKIEVKKHKNSSIIIQNLKSYINIAILSFISIFLTILSNYYFKYLIEKSIINILIFFSIIILLKEVTDYIRNILVARLENKIDECITINTHNKLLSLPYYYFNSRCIGDITSRIQDLEYVKDLYIKLPIFLVIDVLLIILSSIILVKINLYLFLVFLIISILYIGVILAFDKKNKEMVRSNQENNGVNNEILVENIKGISTIKNLNIESYRSNIFKNVYNKYLIDRKKHNKILITENFIKNLILFIGINIILYIGITYVNNGILKLSDLILFNSLILYFIEPLKSLCELNPLLKNGINAIKRVNEIYMVKTNDKEYSKISTYDIDIKKLSFSYDGYNKVFNNINLDIKENDKVVVIGNSGIGKSTLFKLINKTYEVEDNKIFIGNTDINKLSVNKYISYVSQEESLFNDSLYNNLVLGGDISLKKVNEVIKITKLDKVIKSKNINLNSIIYEDGINFSKGERQKIILSRVLLKNKNILILDEALNAIDSNEEEEIVDDLIEKYKNKTIIYITHRDNCISLFKNILDFKKLKEVR